MENVPSLTEVLSLMATGAVAGPVLSFLFEQLAIFQNLSSKAKKIVVVVGMVGMPIIAGAVLQLVPPETLALLEPWWKLLAIGFVSLLGGQLYHKYVNKDEPVYVAYGDKPQFRVAAEPVPESEDMA